MFLGPWLDKDITTVRASLVATHYKCKLRAFMRLLLSLFKVKIQDSISHPNAAIDVLEQITPVKLTVHLLHYNMETSRKSHMREPFLGR